MEKYTTSIVFDHRRRTDKDKEGPLEIRISIARRSYYINTGMHVREREWAGSVIRRADSGAMNDRLGWMLQLTADIMNQMQRNGEPFDVAEVKRRLFEVPEHEESDGMFRWLVEEVPKLKISDGTRRRYDVLLNRLEQYGRLMKWSDLSTERLYDFDRWLHNIDRPMSNGDRQAGEGPRKIGDAAVYNYHRTLRSMLTRAVKFGLLDMNPYDRLRGEFRKGIRDSVQYLTDEEVDAIESLQPMAGSQMRMARDLFVFQLYTGLSYADTQVFDIGDYKKVDGRWVARGERVKTGVAYVSVLLPQAVEVLERYGMQAPKVGNVQYNLSLKTIQQACGIRTRLHSHLARHTFATRALALGVKIENVSAMLGHTNITQTQKYAKVLAQSVRDDFDLMNEKLKRR